MSVKIKVQMTVKYMYDFMLYHNYTRLNGILGVLLGVIGFAMGAVNAAEGRLQGAAIGFFVAIIFFIIVPVSIKNSARRQLVQTKAFQQPLEYEMNEDGVTVRQGEAEALTEWGEFRKVVRSRYSVVLYITRVRAIILPKECIGEQYGDMVKIISAHMPAKSVKLGKV